MSVAIVVPAYRVDSHMAGIGVRAWELAQVMAQYMPVTIVAKYHSDFACAGVTFLAADDDTWPDKVRQCSAALFYDLPDTSIMLELQRAGNLIITDNAVTIEHLEYDHIRNSKDPDATYQELIARFRLQLLISDHFIVRSQVARSTLCAGLSLVGRLSYVNYDRSPSLDHLISYIPIGFNRLSDKHATAVSASLPPIDFVWNGGIWDFYDPVVFAQALAILDRAGTPVTARFMYLPPADQLLREGLKLAQAVRELEIEHLVQFHSESLGHYQRDGVVKSAAATICIGKKGIENFTSIRLRVRDSFLYRLPLIIDNHGATGSLVNELGIGLACNAENANDLAGCLARLRFDRSCYEQLLKNIESVRPEFEIDRYVPKLVEVIKNGRRAPDIGTKRHNSLLSDLLSNNPFLQRSPDYPF
jgi:hypothetical protein